MQDGISSEKRMMYSLGSDVAAMAHEHFGQAPKRLDLFWGQRRPHLQVSAVAADWPFQSSAFAPMAGAVELAAVVAGELAVEAAGVCQASVAVGSENQVTWEAVFDVVEALSCVPVRASLFGWVGNEGKSLAGLRWTL